jgi:hypothetical protein
MSEDELCWRADQGDEAAINALRDLYGPFWRSVLYDRAIRDQEAEEERAIRQAEDEAEAQYWAANEDEARLFLEDRLDLNPWEDWRDCE